MSDARFTPAGADVGGAAVEDLTAAWDPLGGAAPGDEDVVVEGEAGAPLLPPPPPHATSSSALHATIAVRRTGLVPQRSITTVKDRPRCRFAATSMPVSAMPTPLASYPRRTAEVYITVRPRVQVGPRRFRGQTPLVRLRRAPRIDWAISACVDLTGGTLGVGR